MQRKAAIDVHFRFERSLGKGSFGEVCLARAVEPRQQRTAAGVGSKEDEVAYPPTFAVKIIHGKHCSGITLKEIEREMSAVDRFSHPHIVESIDNWLETGDNKYKGCFCLAMTLCEGGDLHNFISHLRHNRTFPSADCVVRVMAHVLSALNYSHSNGVIHRDIKPGNVFLAKESGKQGEAKDSTAPKAIVGDFGLSRPLEYATQMVKTRVGTPGYLSPEIVNGVPYNFKTDLFSAGVLMYELMALERPFWRANYSDSNIYWATVSIDPMPHLMRVAKDRYSSSLCNLVAALISKNPADRPTAFEALTTFSGRIARVIHQERIPVVSDEVLRSEPRSAAVIEQTPLKGPESLTKPRENPKKTPSPAANSPQRQTPDLAVSPRVPPGAVLAPVDGRSDSPAAPRFKYGDPAKSPRANVAAETVPAAGATTPNKLKAKTTFRGKPTSVSPTRVDPTDGQGGHPFAWALHNQRRQQRADVKKGRSATPMPREVPPTVEDESLTPAERLTYLQEILLASPFASPLDEQLQKAVGFDVRSFLFAKLLALGEPEGETTVIAALKADTGKVKLFPARRCQTISSDAAFALIIFLRTRLDQPVRYSAFFFHTFVFTLKISTTVYPYVPPLG
eukprot:gene4018-2872_t